MATDATESSKPTMTPVDVARHYSVDVRLVRGWIDAKLLPALDLSGAGGSRRQYRMSRDDLAEFERRRSSEAVQKPETKRRRRRKASGDPFGLLPG